MIISASYFNIGEKGPYTTDVFKAMVNFGANVKLGTLSLGRALGLPIMLRSCGRKIGTADAEVDMEIVG